MTLNAYVKMGLIDVILCYIFTVYFEILKMHSLDDGFYILTWIKGNGSGKAGVHMLFDL